MRHLRWLSVTTALVLALGAVPVRAASTAPQPITPIVRVDISGLDGADVVGSPVGAKPGESVRLVLELQGNSLVDQVENAITAGNPLNVAQQQSYVGQLRKTQDGLQQQIQNLGGQVLARYHNAYNGISVSVPDRALPQVLSLPGVVSAHAIHLVRPMNETSVPFIGATKVWQMTKDGQTVTGKGIRVAVIDTGIDYTHADFGGTGTPDAYKAIDPTKITPGTFPTAKVIGGYDFAGSQYDAASSDPAKQTPQPDPNPIDEAGHGTHVSGTIAGIGVKNADGSWKIGPGVAPDALLYAYKIFGRSGSTDLIAQAIDRALDPNQDGDLSDHVDVISMSLGSPFGAVDDPSAVAAEKAVDAGVIVVAASGNSGNTPFVTSSPAVAPGVISVASSVDDGIIYSAIKVNSPDSLVGLKEASEGVISKPLAQTGPVTGNVVYVGGTGKDAASIPDSVKGNIALIDRGDVAFSTKILNAQAKGAIAVIVDNNVPKADPMAMGGDGTGITIPAMMITNEDGAAIKSALQSGTVNVTLSADYKIPRPDLADTMSSFSSRGPGLPGSSFKPEISAPGQDIRSAAMGTGQGGVLMSGTSMATPHISGVAALLRQLHPDWSVGEIKAVMMNTATTTKALDGSPYPLSLQGAGRVRADVAAAADAVALPGGLAFGYQPVQHDSKTIQKAILLKNKSDQWQRYSVSWSFLRPSDTNQGVTVDVPTQVKVIPHGIWYVQVKLTIDPTLLRQATPQDGYDKGLNEYDGFITLTGADGSTLRVPFQVFPAAVSAARLNTGSLTFNRSHLSRTVKVRNGGIAPGAASFYTLLGQNDRDSSLPADSDLQYAGVRVAPGSNGSVLEFAAKTFGPWDTLETNQFAFAIDTNNDDKPDYLVFNGDLGLLTGGTDPNGVMVSGVYNQATGKSILQYLVNGNGTRFNSSVMSLLVNESDLGLKPGATAFQVVGVSVNGRDQSSDLTVTNPTFDPANPGYTVADPDLGIDPDARAQTTVSVTDPNATLPDLLVTFPTNADTDRQADVIKLGAADKLPLPPAPSAPPAPPVGAASFVSGQ